MATMSVVSFVQIKKIILNFTWQLSFFQKILDEAAEFKKYHDRSNKNQVKSEDVQIFCKECHKELCLGSDIIKKGTDYICIHPEFKNKVFRVGTSKQIFRHDSNVGKWSYDQFLRKRTNIQFLREWEKEQWLVRERETEKGLNDRKMTHFCERGKDGENER